MCNDICTTLGNDFTDINVRLQFNPGDSESCVQIKILSDNFPERPEVFQVLLRLDVPSSVAEINPSPLTVVINDESYVGEGNTHDKLIHLKFYMAMQCIF